MNPRGILARYGLVTLIVTLLLSPLERAIGQ